MALALVSAAALLAGCASPLGLAFLAPDDVPMSVQGRTEGWRCGMDWVLGGPCDLDRPSGNFLPFDGETPSGTHVSAVRGVAEWAGEEDMRIALVARSSSEDPYTVVEDEAFSVLGGSPLGLDWDVSRYRHLELGLGFFTPSPPPSAADGGPVAPPEDHPPREFTFEGILSLARGS